MIRGTSASAGERAADVSSHAMQAPGSREYVLTVSCPDTVGLVAAVSSLIASWGGWLTEVANHSRPRERAASSCATWSPRTRYPRHRAVRRGLPPASPCATRWSSRCATRARRSACSVLVSREGHCLADLLYRWRTGELRCDLRGVISNHDDLRGMGRTGGRAVPPGAGAGHGQGRGVRGDRPTVREGGASSSRCWRGACRSCRGRLCGAVVRPRSSTSTTAFLPSFAGGRPYQLARSSAG